MYTESKVELALFGTNADKWIATCARTKCTYAGESFVRIICTLGMLLIIFITVCLDDYVGRLNTALASYPLRGWSILVHW